MYTCLHAPYHTFHAQDLSKSAQPPIATPQCLRAFLSGLLQPEVLPPRTLSVSKAQWTESTQTVHQGHLGSYLANQGACWATGREEALTMVIPRRQPTKMTGVDSGRHPSADEKRSGCLVRKGLLSGQRNLRFVLYSNEFLVAMFIPPCREGFN